jgi:ribosome-associated heat shock protein Hsp15
MDWIDPDLESQRVDKWLWHARVVRTRTLASNLVNSGKVRIDRKRINRASQTVRLGNIVTAPQGRLIRTLKIVGFANRRLPAAQIELLYEDQTPAPVEQASTDTKDGRFGHQIIQARREAGSGRPSKRERRMTERLQNRGN